MSHTDFVTIAILAKDKAHVLPLYLKCIENQTYPASKTNLYIRTNNNTDGTGEILKTWLEKVKDRYHEVYFDDSDVPDRVQDFAAHEWNYTRFKVLGAIRQASVDWAKAHNSHYFVADCDNFILPYTIERLLQTALPVVGPLLKNGDSHTSFYANFHFITDENGYFANSDHYYHIYNQSIKGLIEVAVIHCTYFIQNEVLDTICYDDGSARYEYVIFSDTLRKAHIPQYIDNRYDYGSLTFATSEEDFIKENFNF